MVRMVFSPFFFDGAIISSILPFVKSTCGIAFPLFGKEPFSAFLFYWLAPQSRQTYPVTHGIQIQLIVGRDLPELFDVEGGQPCPTGNQDALRRFS